MTPKGVPVNGADVVVSPYPGTGESFENDAESSRRNVKVARLEPNAVHVRNPQLVVFQVGVGNEMVAASLGAVEAVGETRKGSNWHVSPQVRSRSSRDSIWVRHLEYTPKRFQIVNCRKIPI